MSFSKLDTKGISAIVSKAGVRESAVGFEVEGVGIGLTWGAAILLLRVKFVQSRELPVVVIKLVFEQHFSGASSVEWSEADL